MVTDVILKGFTAVINDALVVIGAVLAGALAILPPFPAAPDPPDGGILGFICWVFPLGPMLAVFAALVTCWTIFLGVKVALRWAKAV